MYKKEELFLIIFIISIILILCTLYSVRNFLKTNDRLKESQRKTCLLLSLIDLILCVLDLANIIYSPSLNGMLAITGGISAILLVGIHILDLKAPTKKSNFRFYFTSIVWILILELFVFNFNAFHTVNQDLVTTNLSFDSAILENFTIQDDGSLKSNENGSASIEYLDITPTHIQTLTVEASSSKKSTIECNVDYNETANIEYRTGGVRIEIINNDTKSQTIPTYFSGDTSKIKFRFNVKDGEEITINSIGINYPYGIHFSIVRYLIILSLINGIYYLMYSKNMQLSIKESKSIAYKSMVYVTTGIVILSVFFFNLYRIGRVDGDLEEFKQTSGNQISQEIVDAFCNGQVNLLRDVEPELLELENPYDWSQRDGISYAWDHVMYDGKYYSYYGIAPVLLLFLPYYKLTGYYFPSTWAVWIFCVLGIIFLSKLYYQFVKRFFSHIPIGIMNMGLIILQASTGVWFCMAVPNFYEIAQSSGFASVTIGAYFMLTSNVINDDKVIKWRVALSTIFLSIGVLCRPTLVLYCFVALIFLFFGWKKVKSNKKEMIQYLCCALIPFVVIGGIQVWYNYARFGSIFSFGIEYSLTINDFTTAQYHTHFVLISLYNFLLAVPSFSTDFPFFQSSHSDLNCYGYYFIATSTSMGLIFRALPMFSYLQTGKVYKLIPKGKRVSTLALILPLCVVVPFIIIFSVWESGYAMRYGMDFTWQLLFGAYAISFALYQTKSKDLQNVQYKGFIISMVISLILNFAQVYSYTLGQMTEECKEGFYKLAHMFEFWL